MNTHNHAHKFTGTVWREAIISESVGKHSHSRTYTDTHIHTNGKLEMKDVITPDVITPEILDTMKEYNIGPP